MAVTFDFESDEGIATCIAHGPLTRDEIEKFAAAMWRQVEGPQIRLLWDLREANFDFGAAEVRDLAEFAKPLAPPTAFRSAFVAFRDLEFGLLKMFEVFRATKGAQTCVFRDMPEAVEWLSNGVSCTDLELVTAIDRMNCGVTAPDRDGLVTYANPRILSWLGYAEDELLGEAIEKFIPQELNAPVLEPTHATEEGAVRARITILRRKDATTFPVLAIPNLNSGTDGLFFAVAIELATVQTAEPVAYMANGSLRSSLERIATELQLLGITSAVAGSAGLPIGHPDLQRLSHREHEVLVHLMAGKRVAGIANHLHISPHTVRAHLKSIYRQLEVGSQSELIEHVRGLASPTA